MKILIPNPCNENWNEMLPEEKGHFCLKCSKTVVDFSNKSKNEIKSFFKESTERVCGRFKNDQLYNYRKEISSFQIKRFLAAIYLVFGAFLFSCSASDFNKADKKNKHKDKIELNQTTIGMVAPDSSLIPKTSGNKKKTKKADQCVKKSSKTVIVDTVIGDVMIMGEPIIYVPEPKK